MHRPTWRSAKHAQDFLNSLELYAFPHIGGAKVSNIAASDLLNVLTPIWTVKPETARRVRQRIGTVLKWAVAQGWRLDNPAENIVQALPKSDRTRSQRKALPYGEVSGCLKAIRDSKAGRSTKLALELLVLTAVRSIEVREAQWREIDLAAKVWEIPAARMKTKRLHRIPLAPRAIEILEEARADDDGSASGFIFPGMKHGRRLPDVTLSKLVKELGFNVDVHGFRVSFRMWVQEQTDFPREVAEAALAHAVGDAVEQAYARSDLFQKRRALMDDWARHLAPGMGGVSV